MLRQKSWMTSATTSGALYMSSLFAIPICYVVTNTVKFHVDEDSKGFALLCLGLMSMVFICGVTRALVGKDESPFLYAFAVGGFASVINLMIALENDEWIRGFINGYLEDGEPYLMTSYGTMLSYWGGIGHYTMYLMMVASIAWRQPFRDVGLYWIGSMLHSMLVLVVGVLSSTDQLHWPFILHIPFVVTPIICGFYFLHYKPQPDDKTKKMKEKRETLQECLTGLVAAIKNLNHRVHDLALIAMFLIAVGINIFRGLAALGSGLAPLKLYRDDVEPYMKDPVGFPRIQLLVYMFCFVPCYVMIIYGLLYPNKRWMPDFALLHAGASIQAQVVHIGASLNQRTMFMYRVPVDTFAYSLFWPINILLLVVPQLLAIRCVYWPQYFGEDVAIETVKSKKPVDEIAADADVKPETTPSLLPTSETLRSSLDDDVPILSIAEDKAEPLNVDESEINAPMLKVKFGGPDATTGEIEMSLKELKAYHDDLRTLSASATGRNARRHLSDGGLLPGNIHVRRASGSGRKLTSDDMKQLESLSPSLSKELMKPSCESLSPSQKDSLETGRDRWPLVVEHRPFESDVSMQGDGPQCDHLTEERLQEFDERLSITSSVSLFA